MASAIGTAFLIGIVGVLLAGEFKTAMTVFPSEAAMKFHLDGDGLYRLRFDELPSGIRSGFWLDAVMDMRYRGLAMDCIDGESWILTSSGEKMRKLAEMMQQEE